MKKVDCFYAGLFAEGETGDVLQVGSQAKKETNLKLKLPFLSLPWNKRVHENIRLLVLGISDLCATPKSLRGHIFCTLVLKAGRNGARQTSQGKEVHSCGVKILFLVHDASQTSASDSIWKGPCGPDLNGRAGSWLERFFFLNEILWTFLGLFITESNMAPFFAFIIPCPLHAEVQNKG